MAKFGKGGFGGSSKSNSGFGRNSGGNSRGNFGGGSSFGRNSDQGGNRNQGGGNGGKFMHVGDVTVSKSSIENLGQEVVSQLKDTKMKLWFKPYFRKGTNSLTLTRDSRLLISFDNFEKAPDFVVAKVSIVADDE